MDNEPKFVWTETHLIVEASKVIGRLLIPWELVERLGVSIIRESGAYDQAMVSRSAMNRRYSGKD